MKKDKFTQREIDLIDTVHACLVAAGAPTDIDEQEKVVCAAGTKPSHFIKGKIKKLHNLIWLI